MPREKDLKRLARRRMKKTGESYTTARSTLLRKKNPIPANYETLTGMSDDAVRAKTGRTWPQWVRALDAVDAMRLTHREIAEYLHRQHEVPGWWAQMVTVGYERIRGLREVGQRRGGTFDVSKSKTVGVSVAALYRAWSHKPTRIRWLPDTDITIRTSSKEKSMRITWGDDTAVDVYFTAKGAAKSTVAIQHRKLPSKEAAEDRKTFWTERLAALTGLLNESG